MGKVGGRLLFVGKHRSLDMRKIWQVLVVAVVGLGLSLAVVGCGSSTPGNDKMQGDKMGGDKMGGGKMGGDKMGGDKMAGDKMAGDKMGGDKMAGDTKDKK
jgi:pentapeptide MXKDX repeat protein